MAKQQVTGKRGEDIAAEYLTKLGYTILERNWRIGKAEIDIIANISPKTKHTHQPKTKHTLSKPSNTSK